MKNDMITKALAGSLLVAASMSANASSTLAVSTTFDVLPNLAVTPLAVFAPGTVLTGTSGTVCTWTPTLSTVTAGATAAAITDVTVDRTGDGCPNLSAQPGSDALAGMYTVSSSGTSIPNLDITVELESVNGTAVDWDPTGFAIADDGTVGAETTLNTDVAATVNTGGNGIVNVYFGGTVTLTGTLSAAETVSWNVVTTY